jgi:hypothetical protein
VAVSSPSFQVEFDSTKFRRRRCSEGSCFAKSRDRQAYRHTSLADGAAAGRIRSADGQLQPHVPSARRHGFQAMPGLSKHLKTARLVLGERSPESREVTVGLQSTEARLRLQHAGSRPSQSHRGIAPALHVSCDAADCALHVLDRVGAGQRPRSSGGRRSRLTVSISSRPSKILPDTPGASFCMRRARSRIRRSASAASFSSHALRSARRTLATCFFGQPRRVRPPNSPVTF